MPAATTLTYKGIDVITAAILSGVAPPKYIGWGTNAAAFTTASTDLGTPKDLDLSGAGPARTSGTVTVVSSGGPISNDTINVTGTRIASGSGGTVQELGLFSATTGANMVIGASGQSVLLASGDSIASTWKLAFS